MPTNAILWGRPWIAALFCGPPTYPLPPCFADLAPTPDTSIGWRRRLLSPNQVDNGLGGLRGLLEDLGEWDNTVVIFFSDNGGLPSHGSVNRPFRGGKGEYWEGGVHVPAFLSGGFVSSALARNGVEPYRYGHLTHVTDIHTTMLRLAGLADDGGETLDGVDLWEALVKTNAPARKSVVINLNSANFAKSGAVRWSKYKLMRNPDPMETAIYSHVEKKLINEELVVSEVIFFSFFYCRASWSPFFLFRFFFSGRFATM